MANLLTKKDKHNITVEEIDHIATAASVYILGWAKKESQRLQKHELIITETKSGYLIGKQTITQLGTQWKVTNPFNDVIGIFTSKRSAITWTLLYETNRVRLASTLVVQDSRVNKLQQDLLTYTVKRQRAVKARDYFKVDLLDARSANVRAELTHAQDDLQKTLNSAKYLKGIWEKPL